MTKTAAVKTKPKSSASPSPPSSDVAPAAEWMSPSKLKPWKDNPRKNDGEPVERVAKSIERFGFGAPIVARKANLEIIAGHTRWKAAKKLGLGRVPVRLLDIGEKEAHTLALADNRFTELTEWDATLGAVLAGFESVDAAFMGWTAADIDKIQADLTRGQEVVEDEVPEPPKNPVTKPGDVWTLGRHRVVCGDCRDAATVKALVGSNRINLAFTSPPYASQREYDESSGFKPIAPDAYVEWFELVQANVRSVLANDGSWFVNIKEHCDDGQRSLYVKDLTLAHARAWKWRFVDEFCWTRQGVPGAWNNRFKNGWEPIFHYATQANIKFRPLAVGHTSDCMIEYAATNKKSPSGSGLLSSAGLETHEGVARPNNVLKIGTGAATVTVEHSAAFPVGLPVFFLRAYTDPSDIALDPFLGSGTTLIAAEQLDRTCFGVELSPAYCDVIVERWQNLTGKKATRSAT